MLKAHTTYLYCKQTSTFAEGGREQRRWQVIVRSEASIINTESCRVDSPCHVCQALLQTCTYVTHLKLWFENGSHWTEAQPQILVDVGRLMRQGWKQGPEPDSSRIRLSSQNMHSRSTLGAISTVFLSQALCPERTLQWKLEDPVPTFLETEAAL